MTQGATYEPLIAASEFVFATAMPLVLVGRSASESVWATPLCRRANSARLVLIRIPPVSSRTARSGV